MALATNNPSEEEALAAAAKAQSLMAREGLRPEDIPFAEEREEPSYTAVKTTAKNWRYTLASIVARNFRCQAAKTPDGIAFFGYETDMRIAETVFLTLYKIGNLLGNKAVRHYKAEYPRRKTTGVFETYIAGFCDGIENQLGIQRKALMLMVPEEVTKFTASKVTVRKSTRKRPKMSSSARSLGHEWDVYAAGKTDGRLAVSRPIEGDTK